MTDNKNRTVAEVRHAFSKGGGNLGTDGSVAFMFEKRGQISLAPGADEDTVMEIALEAGAEDIETDDDGLIEVLTTAEDFLPVKDALAEGGFEPEASEVAMVPQSYSTLEGDQAEKAMRLLEDLEDLDDVQNVYTNADFV